MMSGSTTCLRIFRKKKRVQGMKRNPYRPATTQPQLPPPQTIISNSSGRDDMVTELFWLLLSGQRLTTRHKRLVRRLHSGIPRSEATLESAEPFMVQIYLDEAAPISSPGRSHSPYPRTHHQENILLDQRTCPSFRPSQPPLKPGHANNWIRQSSKSSSSSSHLPGNPSPRRLGQV
jgi:hypothetical protein